LYLYMNDCYGCTADIFGDLQVTVNIYQTDPPGPLPPPACTQSTPLTSCFASNLVLISSETVTVEANETATEVMLDIVDNAILYITVPEIAGVPQTWGFSACPRASTAIGDNPSDPWCLAQNTTPTCTGPDDVSWCDKNYVNKIHGMFYGALAATIDSDPFSLSPIFIGDRFCATICPGIHALFLYMNDCCYDDNHGSLSVHVALYAPPPPPTPTPEEPTSSPTSTPTPEEQTPTSTPTPEEAIPGPTPTPLDTPTPTPTSTPTPETATETPTPFNTSTPEENTTTPEETSTPSPEETETPTPEEGTSNATTATTTPAQPAASISNGHAALIVGLVVGLILGVGIIAALLFWILRKAVHMV